MRLVKVSKQFYIDALTNGTNKELLENEAGRPCVLIVDLVYKGKKIKFVVPLRSNISSNTPSKQFFSLPPNSRTKPGKHHGIHYIKMFPINNKYINNYLISGNNYLIGIKQIIDKNESAIIKACQDFLTDYENGKGTLFTPDIDGILNWVNK